MTSNTSRITVRLQPRAFLDEILGLNEEGLLSVSVKAPPVDGGANEVLVQLLGKMLGIRKGSIALVSGAKARNKIIEVEGLTASELRSRIAHQ